MKDFEISRRSFMAAAAPMAVHARRHTKPAPTTPAAATDRISVAVIGCGVRDLTSEVLRCRATANAAVTVVCDTWRQQREHAAAQVRKATGHEPAMITRYRDVLDRQDVDAVVIATPDHLHCAMLQDAITAGKDVYIEKPLAMNMRELTETVDFVKRSDRIVQVGTQVRSFPSSVSARAFVRNGGLGKIFKVEQSRNAHRPYWQTLGERPVRQEDVDWEAFLQGREPRPWNADQYVAWYGYREFSLGPQTGLMTHFVDLVHFITGAQFPTSVTAAGGRFRFRDARTAPDSIEAALEYNGFLARYSTTFGTDANSFLKFFGTRGAMDATRWEEPWILSGQDGEPDSLRPHTRIPALSSTPHMQNWLECVRSRKQPAAPIETAYQQSVACLMTDEAFLRGSRVHYDAASRRIITG